MYSSVATTRGVFHAWRGVARRVLPLLDVGRDAEVAGAQLAAHLLDLQLHCNGTG